MADLQRLESSTGNPRQGGFVIRFESGRAEVIEWDRGAPFSDAAITPAAKQLTARVLDKLLTTRAGTDDAERTNWASVTAAVQRILVDWNEGLKRHVYATGSSRVH